MAQFVYTTKNEDMLDQICKDYYGDETSPIQPVLQANPGLAALGPLYPAGIKIILPDIPGNGGIVKTIKLWD